MKKKTDKYVSHDMQNEMLKVMSLQVSHKIIDCLHSADYFSIMIDETTDCSNFEQVVICCRLIAHWKLMKILWDYIKLAPLRHHHYCRLLKIFFKIQFEHIQVVGTVL